MLIGQRLKRLREDKELSQGDMENRTGLLRCYISRVENGHTVPSLETLERLAAALEIPMFRLFCEDAQVDPGIAGTGRAAEDEAEEHESEADKRFFGEIKRLLRDAGQQDRRFFLNMARRLANR